MKTRYNIHGILLRIGVAALLLGHAASMSSATPEEMDRARAVAAQVYVRYQNDDAGYLDGKKPSSISELRALVSGHATDEQNLRQFLEQPVDNDFESWNQDQLANYWGGRFFDTSNLSSHNADTRNRRIQARIKTMDVTVVAPAAETQTPEQTQPTQSEYNNYQDVTFGDGTQTPAVAATDTIQNTDEVTEETVTTTSSNNMWLYIVLLIVLIVVVIALVVFAMRAVRHNREMSDRPSTQPLHPQGQPQMVIEPEPAPVRRTSAYAPSSRQTQNDYPTTADDIDTRYAHALSQKNETIEQLRGRLQNAEAAEAAAREHSEALASRLGALQMELQQLRDENTRLRQEAMPQPVKPQPAPGVPGTPRPSRFEQHTTPAPGERVIYLGRANRDRIFVRADKNLTPGKSVYRLVTTNGMTGSFAVDTDPSVAAMAALAPATVLYGACELPSSPTGADFTRIVTDTAGTAIFEDGCWKVLRPCAAHLE